MEEMNNTTIVEEEEQKEELMIPNEVEIVQETNVGLGVGLILGAGIAVGVGATKAVGWAWKKFQAHRDKVKAESKDSARKCVHDAMEDVFDVEEDDIVEEINDEEGDEA